VFLRLVIDRGHRQILGQGRVGREPQACRRVQVPRAVVVQPRLAVALLARKPIRQLRKAVRRLLDPALSVRRVLDPLVLLPLIVGDELRRAKVVRVVVVGVHLLVLRTSVALDRQPRRDPRLAHIDILKLPEVLPVRLTDPLRIEVQALAPYRILHRAFSRSVVAVVHRDLVVHAPDELVLLVPDVGAAVDLTVRAAALGPVEPEAPVGHPQVPLGRDRAAEHRPAPVAALALLDHVPVRVVAVVPRPDPLGLVGLGCIVRVGVIVVEIVAQHPRRPGRARTDLARHVPQFVIAEALGIRARILGKTIGMIHTFARGVNQ